MSTERDQGFAALQQNDLATAVPLLEQACQNDPNDYQAHMYLGAAYGKAGRHPEAVQILTSAVMLQPANAQARYNLGVAYERAGYSEQAVVAMEQALTLQPDYPKATEALRRLKPDATTAMAPPPAAQPTQYAPQAAPPQPNYGGYAPPGQAPSPYGAQPTQPPNYLPPQGYGQPAPGASPYASYPVRPYIEDKFDLVQAFRDIGQIIAKPRAFYQSQLGRDGYNAPMAFLLATTLINTVVSIIGTLVFPPPTGGAAGIVGGIFGAGFGFIIGLLGAFVSAAIYHLAIRIMRGQGNYNTTFRASVYAGAPIVIFTVLFTLIGTPMVNSMQREALSMSSNSRVSTRQGGVQMDFPNSSPGMEGGDMTSSRPGRSRNSQDAAQAMEAVGKMFAMLIPIILIGFGFLIWYLVVLTIGFSEMHQISGGAAFGAIVLSWLFWLLFAIAIGVLFAGLLMAAFAGASGRGMILF